MATSAPSSARRTAIACPRPRPDPVTSATSPFNENSLSIFSHRRTFVLRTPLLARSWGPVCPTPLARLSRWRSFALDPCYSVFIRGLQPAERLQIGDALSQLLELVVNDCRR